MRTKRITSMALLLFICLFSFSVYLAFKKNILYRQKFCQKSCNVLDKKYSSSSLPAFQEDYNLLLKYRTKRATREKLTEPEMIMLTEILVKEVSVSEYKHSWNDLGGCLGTVCMPYAYVEKDFSFSYASNQAKKFVKRHELIHLLNNRNDFWGEMEANFKAALKYPYGAFTVINPAWYWF